VGILVALAHLPTESDRRVAAFVEGEALNRDREALARAGFRSALEAVVIAKFRRFRATDLAGSCNGRGFDRE
jgi:hypothetical protein